jgi:hypothetical protein
MLQSLKIQLVHKKLFKAKIKSFGKRKRPKQTLKKKKLENEVFFFFFLLFFKRLYIYIIALFFNTILNRL